LGGRQSDISVEVLTAAFSTPDTSAPSVEVAVEAPKEAPVIEPAEPSPKEKEFLAFLDLVKKITPLIRAASLQPALDAVLSKEIEKVLPIFLKKACLRIEPLRNHPPLSPEERLLITNFLSRATVLTGLFNLDRGVNKELIRPIKPVKEASVRAAAVGLRRVPSISNGDDFI
jgi:hypothetical protein